MNKQLVIFLLIMGLIVAGLIIYHFEREQPVYSNIFFGLLPLAPTAPAYTTVSINISATAKQTARAGAQIKITPGGQ